MKDLIPIGKTIAVPKMHYNILRLQRGKCFAGRDVRI
jgi:hypothetical protein